MIRVFIVLIFLFSLGFSQIKSSSISYNEKVYFYNDKTQSLNINDIYIFNSWSILKKDNLGFNNGNYWLRFEFRAKEDKKLYFLFEKVLTSELEIYIYEKRELLKKESFGLLHGLKDLSPKGYKIGFNVKKEKNYTIYLKIKNRAFPYEIAMKILNKEELLKEENIKNGVYLVFFAVIILMVFYNGIIYLVTKFGFYRFYLLYSTLLFFVMFYNSGYFFYLFYEGVVYDEINFVFKLISLVFIFSMLLLLNKIINEKKEIFYKYKEYFFIMLILFIIEFILLKIDFDFTYLLQYFIKFLFLFIVLQFCIYMIKESFRKNKIALYVFLSWLPIFLVIALSNINQVYHFIDGTIFEYLIKAFFIFESIAVSLILAYKLKLIDKEKNELLLYKKEQELIKNRENKLATLGEMLNSIAHQWKQPLMRINASLFDMFVAYEQKRLDNETFNKKIEQIESETKYMSQTISSLSNFLYPHKKIEQFKLYDSVSEQLKYILNNPINSNLKLEYEIICENRDILVEGFKKEYEQVVIAIIENAIDVFKTENKNRNILKIELSFYKSKPRLIIENSGENIKDEYLNKIFEPYFSTKNKKEVSGVGLYMSKLLIEKSMNKSLRVENCDNGVRFIIWG